MQLKRISKNDLAQNPQNPRTITDHDRAKLVLSLIDFPEMLMFRPIVLGSGGISLGGNQRLEAITEIRAYTPPVKQEILEDQRIIRKRAGITDEQLEKFEEAMNYLLYDQDFLVLDVSFLSQDKQEEFIIKDNVAFGSWDWEAVDSLWGKEKVESWGLEVPKWIEAKEEKNDEKEITDDDVETAHQCPKCGYEFN